MELGVPSSDKQRSLERRWCGRCLYGSFAQVRVSMRCEREIEIQGPIQKNSRSRRIQQSISVRPTEAMYPRAEASVEWRSSGIKRNRGSLPGWDR